MFDFSHAGFEILVTVYKDGRYTAATRFNEQSSWGPPVTGTVYK